MHSGETIQHVYKLPEYRLNTTKQYLALTHALELRRIETFDLVVKIPGALSMDGAFTFHEYSCALCRNRVNLTEACCCKDPEGGLVEVTDPHLVKRANLQHGDKLCPKHLEKLKRGVIFGHKNSCCAPFHVETSPGRRLRNVPRPWRGYFETTEFSPRYMPALQICDACYKITLDVLFDSGSSVEGEENGSADFLPTSPTSRYLSPRRWISSQSLHNLDSNSESSGWSITSPQRIKSSKTLLSLYASSREKYGHPKVIPASIKRYLLSRADSADRSETSSVKMALSRRESEVDTHSLASSQDQSDLSETPKSAKALEKRVSSKTLLQNVSENDSKVAEAEILNDSHLDADVETVKVASQLEAKNNLTLVDNFTADLANGSDNTSASEKGEDGSEVAEEQNTSPGRIVTIKDPETVDGPSTDVICETHEFVSIPNNIDSAVELNKPQFKSDDKEVTTSLHTTGKTASHVERLSHSLANEIVFFVLNYFSSSRGSNTSERSDALPSRDTTDSLEVFANTLASSFVSFAIEESRRQVAAGSDTASHGNNKALSSGLDNFGAALSDVILADVGIAIQELHACCLCRGKILKHCVTVVNFAQKEAERIMSTALTMFQQPRLRLEQERLASDIVDKAVSSALLLMQFERKEENGNTEVEWIESKQCYRTVFSIAVNGVNSTGPDEKESDLNLDRKKLPKIRVDDSVTVNCYVDDLLPVTRSLSNGFIDQISGDDDNLSQAELRKSVSNDSIFLMVCEPVPKAHSANEDEVLVQNLNVAHLPKQGNKFERKPMPGANMNLNNGVSENEAPDVSKDANEEPVEILTFYPSSNEDEVSSDASLASSSSVSSSLEEILDLCTRNDAHVTAGVIDCCNGTHDDQFSGEMAQEAKTPTVSDWKEKSIQEILSTQTETTFIKPNSSVEELGIREEIIGEQKEISVEEVVISHTERCSGESNASAEEICVQEKDKEPPLSRSLRKSLTFDESPLLEEKVEDETKIARKIPKTLQEEDEDVRDILPQIDTMLHRRRTQQFNRAVSDAEIVRNRCRSAMLPSKKGERNASKPNPEDAEPDDTADVICSTIADATPAFLRRIPPRNEQETEEQNSKSRAIWKAVTFVGLIGVLFYAGWKYYYM